MVLLVLPRRFDDHEVSHERRSASVITFDARNHHVHKDRIDVGTLDHSTLSGWTGQSTSSGRGAISID